MPGIGVAGFWFRVSGPRWPVLPVRSVFVGGDRWCGGGRGGIALAGDLGGATGLLGSPSSQLNGPEEQATGGGKRVMRDGKCPASAWPVSGFAFPVPGGLFFRSVQSSSVVWSSVVRRRARRSRLRATWAARRGCFAGLGRRPRRGACPAWGSSEGPG